jgi:hypothetical protein
MSKETTSGESTQEVEKIVNTISLEKAQKWARRWAKKEGNYNKHHELSAFLIPKIDLVEVLREDVDAVRAYIGIHKKHDGTYEEKLMIVGTKYNPVTKVYEDMITVGELGNATSQNDIYDFTSPCPPAGDPESLLNI